jgi:hypothetical protein
MKKQDPDGEKVTGSPPGLADGNDELLDGLLGEVELHGLVEDEEDQYADKEEAHQHPRPDHPAGVRADVCLH